MPGAKRWFASRAGPVEGFGAQPMSEPAITTEAVRGEGAVRTALLEAACDMLAEVGPKSLSVRRLAQRAGVNHGQIHHYFDGKRGLLKAAMAQLADEHWRNTRARIEASGGIFPPALALAEDTRYWRATCHAVLEDDLELAAVELEEGKSVPRQVYDALVRQDLPPSEALELKADFALFMVSQLGWVAFEAFAFLVSEVEGNAEEAVRALVRDRITKMAQQLMDDGGK